MTLASADASATANADAHARADATADANADAFADASATADDLATLCEVRRLLARPYGWCKGEYSRPEPRCDDGYAYCLSGAIWAGGSESRWQAVYDRLRVELPLPVFNDAPSTRKRDVLALVDRAIAACEKEIGS